jgi:hypothetical protein
MARHRTPTDEHADCALQDTPRLSPSVQAEIGQRLKAFYAALALGEQPVPDRFIEIINQLDHGRPLGPQEKRS